MGKHNRTRDTAWRPTLLLAAATTSMLLGVVTPAADADEGTGSGDSGNQESPNSVDTNTPGGGSNAGTTANAPAGGPTVTFGSGRDPGADLSRFANSVMNSVVSAATPRPGQENSFGSQGQ